MEEDELEEIEDLKSQEFLKKKLSFTENNIE